MAKYPSPSYAPLTLSNATAEGKQGVTHEGATPFPVNASQRVGVSGYSKTGDENRRWELVLDRLLHFMQLMPEATTTALQLAVNSGQYVKADGTKVSFSQATVAIPDATTGRLVWIDVASNALAQGAAWPGTETDYFPIAIVDTAGGAITQIKDARQNCWNRIHAAVSDVGITNQTSFTIDADNAVAEVDTDLRFNRGSSDAEDAALRWVAASTIFRLLKKHTAATRAGLDCEKLQVAGADVVETDGKLVAAAIKAARLYTFGANGATPAGILLTLAGSPGAPASGTHVAGELHVDSVGAIFICTAGGTPGTWQQLGKQDATVVMSVADASGSSAGATLDCTIQAKDAFGNNLAQAVLFTVYLMDDVDGVADAANVTAFTVPTGTLVRAVTANKIYRIKTNASGTAVIRVTNSIADTVYVLLDRAPGSPKLDTADTGAMVWT